MLANLRVLVIAALLAFASGRADALVLGAIADTHVEAKDSDDNFGAFSTNRAGHAFFPLFPNAFNLLLQFDASMIPGNATVASATLRLFIDDTTFDPLGLPITVERLLSTFVEGDGMSGVTWDTQPAAAMSPASDATMNQSAGEWFEIDVTAVVSAALASGDTPGIIPLRVVADDGFPNTDREFSVRSKEFGDGSQRAQLVMQFDAGSVPLLSLPMLVGLVAILCSVGILTAWRRLASEV